MRKIYREWIATWLASHDPHSACAQATLDMQAAFPELTRVRGHYVCVLGDRPHWWLRTPLGKVVDPTVSQFGCSGVYDPYDEAKGEPKGKCINCGKLSYYQPHCCSDACEAFLQREFDESLPRKPEPIH